VFWTILSVFSCMSAHFRGISSRFPKIPVKRIISVARFIASSSPGTRAALEGDHRSAQEGRGCGAGGGSLLGCAWYRGVVVWGWFGRSRKVLSARKRQNITGIGKHKEVCRMGPTAASPGGRVRWLSGDRSHGGAVFFPRPRHRSSRAHGGYKIIAIHFV